jgi:hypothetical protein
MLFASRLGEAENPIHRKTREDVVATLSRGGDLRAFEHAVHLVASESVPVAECLCEEFAAARERCVIESDLAPASGAALDDARREEPEHPSYVICGHEVKRAAHGPGANDLPIRDGALDLLTRRVGESKADRP